MNAASGNNGNPLSLSTVQSRSQLSSNYGDGKAYSKPVYEASPLDRVLEQYGPGQEWHNNGKRVKTEYLSNTADGELSCRWYRTTDTRGNVQVSIQSGKVYYPAGELYVTRTTDEEGTGISLEFKDKQGHLLLTRRKNGTSYHDTYYVYDSYSNLRAVLPPLAADALAAAGTWTVATDGTGVLAQYAYLYKYDDRNRCIWKKLPGADWIRYEYDRADRMIASQDGEQTAKSPALCTFYLYDIDNRPVIQGTCEFRGSIASLGSTAMLTSLKRSYDGKIIASGLENSGYNPNMTLYSPVVHTINYYDDYGFRSLTGFDNESYFPKESHPAGGLLTGMVTTLLDGSGKKLYTAYYYDEKGRPEKTVSSNHLGGYDITTTVYTFTGKPKTVTHVHTATGKAQQTQVYTYTYDHADRVKTVTHKLNAGSAVTLANNTYDDLGRLKKNSRNGVSSLSDSYTYNVRSWLTGISGSQYVENLTYDYLHSSESNLWSILYMTGYLTEARISEGKTAFSPDTKALKIPNAEIREIFETTVMKWFADSVKKWNRTAIFQALWNQKPEIITREMNLLLWNTISYHDYKEDFYHAFLTGIFMGAGEQIESNKEHGLGRPDLVIIDKANGKVAIFEVKYSQSMKQLNKDCDKALAQMKERKYAEDYKDRYKDIFCYGISFYKKECLVKMLES